MRGDTPVRRSSCRSGRYFCARCPGYGSDPVEQFRLLRGELLVGEDAALMQPGQRLDGRDYARGIPGRRLCCLRSGRLLRRRVGSVLRGGWGGRSLGRLLGTQLCQARYVEGAELAGEGHGAVSAALLLLHATDPVLAGVEDPG